MTEDEQPLDRRKSPRRKEEYDVLDKKIDKRFDALTARLARFIVKALVGFTVLGVACAVGLLGFGIVLHRQGSAADDIQQQRKEAIRRTCTEQNDRHDETYSKLIDAAKTDEDQRTTEAGKQEVRRRRDVTLALIDALAPHQNCDDMVNAATKENPKASTLP